MSVFNGQETIIVCRWCGKKLTAEFYFKCPKCEETYCFVHMDRHIRSPCKKR